MLAAAAQQVTPPPTAGEVAEALRAVLARPEFQPGLERPGQGLLARVVRWLFDLVDRLLPDIPALPGGPLLNAIAVAGLVAGAVLLVRRLVRDRARRRGRIPATASGESAPSLEPALERTAAQWEARARELLAAGRAREAALALYQSVLRRLADAGLIRYHTSKTPGDYRREIAGAPAAGAYAAFLRGFEPLAFATIGIGDRVELLDRADVPALFTLAREVAQHG